MTVFLSAELWCEIFYYFRDIKDAIRTWIAFGLRKVISKQHQIWMFLLVDLLKDSTISSFLQRINCPTLPAQKQGLVFLSRIYQQKKCCRSGCFQMFSEIQNTSKLCRFHSGKMTSVGNLSCCREKSFRVVGCKTGYHCGDFYDYVFSLRDDSKITAKTASAPAIIDTSMSLDGNGTQIVPIVPFLLPPINSSQNPTPRAATTAVSPPLSTSIKVIKSILACTSDAAIEGAETSSCLECGSVKLPLLTPRRRQSAA